MTERSLLDITLAAARRDEATVTPDGRHRQRLIEGVEIRPLATHADERGSLVELIDERWNHGSRLSSAHCYTLRPGCAKGWNLHMDCEDRCAIVEGEMALVLYDPRAGSTTYGEVSRIVLSGRQRCLVNVPPQVWHADHNIGTTDVVVINFPTTLYDHADPDKYRLPLDTPLIPYSFGGTKG